MVEESVFRSQQFLEPDFVPEELPGREAETRGIADAFRPALQGATPLPLWVSGRTGVGKTSCLKFVARELEENSNARVVYVNCWQNYTRQGMLSELARTLGEALPRRGLAGDEVFSRAMQACKHSKLIPVVILDEVDQLIAHKEERALYDLTRAKELFGVPLGLACVTNDETSLARLDDRVRSAFSSGQVFFKPYSPKQLKEILLSRLTAFRRGAVKPDALALCAAIGAKNGGDARISIQLLLAAGRNADKRGSGFVEVVDVPKQSGASRQKKFSRLSQNEEKVYSLIRDGMRSGELYEAMRKAGVELSERSVRNILSALEKKRFVELEESSGSAGRTRIIKRLE
ncbi:hypothetical protein COX85_00845 [Candidatus Micrarchaeota archaeon CG_4_10_14_0_2_um_filter_55_9]|nr:MAG: hypothetical protein AUJ15_04130 [Candidatus Micrarchaeota archaeon CG1_02_55_41]PIO02964.1 MAG: hypothetical protein COT57_01525 [Candidatus Micrarchaeota archaeon CG09_land_8_20_14_0_10_55_25]PIZ92019.1 MAG: hypothetical protein COX85_00845 [Candidatus Micrarchaeota archaeon CG_4_10_14_0_2_um_filter_55_9]PJD01315.1 MAG: hypothetical protein COU38_01540 [Candidatus Micrarchaeota archaeon CG10_big_fil_rev_8_21_14_0_10_54_18]